MTRASVPPRRAAGGLALALALGTLGWGAPAQAAGPKEIQGQKALKLALEDDYLQTRFDAAEKRLRVALQVCGKACSPGLRARLHAALGAVLAGGKKELQDARDEFVEALEIDPACEPNPDVLSTEVSFAFEQAKKELHLASSAPVDVKPVPKTAKAADAPPADDEEKPARPAGGEKADGDAPPETPPPAPPPVEARRNWITVAFSPDLGFISGTDVCTAASQNGAHFYCARANGSQYVGTPTLGTADNVNTGIALATLRVTLGYERLVHPNVSVGARVGFAFDGASGAGASFLPLHVEGRLDAWVGHDPFGRAGVRPYFTFAGGVAQIDTKISVQVVENGVTCGAADPSSNASPCTKPSADGVLEPRVQALTAWRQTGLGFGAAGFGLQFAPTARVALHLAVRGTVTFPVVGGAVSPEGGLSVGF